jgi:hypothetical protein
MGPRGCPITNAKVSFKTRFNFYLFDSQKVLEMFLNAILL